MQIAIVDTGYVSLVTGTCLADFGLSVTCVDHKTKQKFLFLTLGESLSMNLILFPLIKKNVSAGRLIFTTDLEKAVKESKVIIYYQFGEAMYIIYLKNIFIKNLSNLI